jgi:cytochrome c-type biogenesis protein CcmF
MNSGEALMIKPMAQVTVLSGGDEVTQLNPGREIFLKSGQPVTPPAVYNFISGDLYVILTDWDDDFSSVVLKVYLNPLIGFLWLGGVMLIVGTGIVLWPPPARARTRAVDAKPAAQPQEAVSP